MKILRAEYVRSDERGNLIQLITKNFKQLNILSIKHGNKFGGHYHKHKEEVFYVVSGWVDVVTTNVKTGKPEKHTFLEGTMFLVEPYDIHTIIAVRDSVLVEALTEPYHEDDVHAE